MKVVDPGRSYELAGGNGLVFLQTEDGWISRDGTTNEEVLDVLIERVTEDYRACPSREGIRALYLLREALAALRQLSERPPRAGGEGTGQARGPATESAEALLGRIASCEPDARQPLPAALALSLRRRRDPRPDAVPDRHHGPDAGVGIGR